ncbi:MAG: hypothetical protein IJ270_01675 [Paludibacteraceae bacterium]|nr:hypothetical protein [Paludibacteraceae bacterium]
MDFTILVYKTLLKSFKSKGYKFVRFEDYLKNPQHEKTIILRHDVDKKPQNALKIAQVEAVLDIVSTYYFRMKKCSWNENVVKQIAALGHEVGYHYENISDCDGNIDEAYQDFCENLQLMRSVVPIKTICMHGSPRSKYDNKILWTKYDYRSLDLLSEPYIDLDFSKVFYITDTGRRWDGDKFSVRDKVQSSCSETYHKSQDIILAIEEDNFPNQVMVTTHPQRWTDNWIEWLLELVLQNLKNQIKRFFVK